MASALAIIISTSAQRERHLNYCLNALKNQRFQDFEIVIVDDGQHPQNAAVADHYLNAFKSIAYLSRPQDGNLSHSRNLGAQATQAPHLLFLNTDILLNPEALKAYMQALKTYPQKVIWGYVGCRKKYQAPSAFFSDVQVNWLDFRFFPLSSSESYLNPTLQYAPHTLASGHHFALTRRAYQEIGPLDSDFKYWGEEDVEYALRGIIKGYPMLLLGAAWGEHMVHHYTETFHLHAQQQAILEPKIKTILQLEVYASQRGIELGSQVSIEWFEAQPKFWDIVKKYYLPHSPNALQSEQGLSTLD